MYDTAPIALQRSHGTARVAFGASGRLTGLYQQGCAKAFVPRSHTPVPEAVFLNTAGGVTGGDRLRYDIDLAAGARLTATTQTAERIYRASGGSVPGSVSVAARVGDGAVLHWLPQETILFDGARLERTTDIRLEGDRAACLFCETLVLGRAAMGETVRDLVVEDRRRVTRDGVPVLIEPLRLTAQALVRDSAGAGLAGARALATIALVAPDAPDALAPVRRLIGEQPGVAASAWDGKLVIRMLAEDPAWLRRMVAAALTTLRGCALPRVWQI